MEFSCSKTAVIKSQSQMECNTSGESKSCFLFDHLDDTLGFHVEGDRELVVHPVLGIGENTLVLRIEMLALSRELFGTLVDKMDQLQYLLAASVGNDVVESILTGIAVFDPFSARDGQMIDEGYSFLLGKDLLDPAYLSLVLQRNIYSSRLLNKERLENIILLRTLVEKTHVSYIVYKADSLCSIDNIVSNLKSHIPLLPVNNKKFLKNYLQN